MRIRVSWTAEEERLLRQAAASGKATLRDLVQAMPQRTANAIYQRLGVLRLTGQVRVGDMTAALFREKRSKYRYATPHTSRPGMGAARVTETRSCMSCRCAFRSEGIHNRLCEPCRGRGAALSPFAP